MPKIIRLDTLDDDNGLDDVPSLIPRVPVVRRFRNELIVAAVIVSLVIIVVVATVATRTHATPEPTPPAPAMELTTIYLLEDLNEMYFFNGSGSNWRNMSGVGVLYFDANQPFNVTYINRAREPSIIHAHGMLPPYEMDGVQYMPRAPMLPDQQMHIEFEIPTHMAGSYFIHSHYGFHMGEGLTAPMIVAGEIEGSYPLSSQINVAHDVVMFLQDMCPYFYAAPRPGCNFYDVFTQLEADWAAKNESESDNCPEPKDMDVRYRIHTVNGRQWSEPHEWNVTVGDKLRLRVINSAGMTHYYIVVPDIFQPQLFAVDSKLVIPITQSRAGGGYWIATAQRLDLLLTAPEQSGNYCIVAYIEQGELFDRTGFCIVVNDRNGIHSPFINIIPSVTNPVGMMAFQLETVLRAFEPMSQNPANVYSELYLTGDNGFDSMNNKSWRLVPFTPRYTRNPTPIVVSKGQRVHIKINNTNADNHAMHLHGHTFQVIALDDVPYNGPVRDTVLVPGSCHSVTIAIEADNVGDWLFHCHMEFHMAAGMITSLRYRELDDDTLLNRDRS